MTDHAANVPLTPGADRQPETFCSSGTSPTLHLCGAGAVGCELLELAAASPFRLIAVSDSTATILRRDWLDPQSIAAHKRAGGRIADLDGSDTLRTEIAVDVIDADVVVDVTPSDFDRVDEARRCGDAVLRRGGRLVLASKAALCASAGTWFADGVRERIGCNAVLGGAGAALRDELAELRQHARSAAQCGNATTTVIIETVEAGGTIADGIDRARAAGMLEADPELDLCGGDAAVKLALVHGALRGTAIEPSTIARPDVRELDVAELRARARRGATTRLVGRVRAGGQLTLEFEELPRTAPLVAPPDRVVYTYELASGETRVHVGTGVGPRGTAEAAWLDIVALCAEGGAR